VLVARSQHAIVPEAGGHSAWHAAFVTHVAGHLPVGGGAGVTHVPFGPHTLLTHWTFSVQVSPSARDRSG
jgi:hypothetical protein